jgi:hypothetical protein
MNKIFAVVTGVGLGAALVYLFAPAKKKSCVKSAREKMVDIAGDRENVGDASSVGGDFSEPCKAEPLGELSGFRKVESICGRTWKWSSPGGMWRWVIRGGRLVYRSICRISFRVCLCAAGLRTLARLFDHRRAREPSAVGHARLSKKEYTLVAGFTAIAFLTRLAALRLRPILTPDGVYYATMGKLLAAGNFKEGLSTFWAPLYPFLVGVSSLVFRDIETGGKSVSILAGSLLVIPVYLLARTLYGKDTASIGAFLIAVNPTLIQYSTRLLTESTYTLLLAVVLYAGLTALTGGGITAFFSVGAALGACYLIRPEAIGYTGLMLALALCGRLRGDSLPPSEVLRYAVSLVAGFSLLALPYILFLRRATGRWTISEKLRAHVHSTESWETNWFGLPQGWQTTLADRLYAGVSEKGGAPHTGETVMAASQSLREMIRRSLEALKLEIQLMVYRVIPPQFMAPMGLGLFRTDWRKEIYLLSFASATLVGYALCPDDVSDRLLVPLLPLQLCWAAKGIAGVEKRLAGLLSRLRFLKALSFRNPAPLRPLVLTLMSLSLLPSLAYNLMTVPPKQQLEYRRAGAWVKEHSVTPARVMATDPYTAFYAGRRHLYLPAEGYAAVIEHARCQKVDYLVIDEGVVSKGRWGNNEYARLRFLLDEQSHHPELKLVYKFDGLPNRKLLIFTLT